MGSFLYGCIFFNIRYSLKTRPNGYLLSLFFLCLIHGILFLGVFVPILLNFFNRQNNESAATVLSIISTPIIMFIIISWIFIHIKFFYFPISTIERSLNHISEGIKNGVYKSQTLNKLKTSVWWKLWNRRINLASSAIIGTIYCYCEINLWIFMKDELLKGSENMNSILFAMSDILFILNPAFLIFGIALVVSNYKNSNKFLLAPLFCGSLPMIALMPLYSYLKTIAQMSDLIKIIFFGFPIGIFFWITLILTGVTRKSIFYSAITILCLFVLLPFGYFFTLSEQSAFRSDQPISSLINALGITGAGLFGLMFLFITGRYFYRKFTKKEISAEKTNRFNIAVYFYANLKDCGFWFNAMFFMTSFIAILYAIYNRTSSSAIEAGTVIIFF